MRWPLVALFFGITLDCTIAQESSSQIKSDEPAPSMDDSKAWNARRVAECEAHEFVQLSPNRPV